MEITVVKILTMLEFCVSYYRLTYKMNTVQGISAMQEVDVAFQQHGVFLIQT
jgi:hypothetical protein